jgi:RNA methyltransferase, TrmH family
MKIATITSESNNTLKSIRALHRRQAREKEKLFLLEGTNCLAEALRKQIDLKAVVVSQSYLAEHLEELLDLELEKVSVVEDKIFAALATTATSCGVLAVAALPGKSKTGISNWQPRIVAIADAIQDPGNLGTLIRTAYAAELGGLILLKGSVDPFNPKVVRAAAGALFSLPIISDLETQEVIELLRSNQMRIIICQASASKRYFEADLTDSVAIVLGNEGQGVSTAMSEAADESISIPMNPGSESLNVAISGGIILFETLKQRLTVANS